MFALCTAQPQLALPVGHLASVWHAVRSASQTIARTQTRQGQQHVTASVSADEFSVSQQELSNGVKETLNELGLSDLAKHVKIEVVHPVLEPNPQTDRHRHIEPSYISAESFFVNKHGYTVKELLHPSVPIIRVSFPLVPQPNRILNNHWIARSFSQQRRGFKTVRQRKSYGLGSEAPKHAKIMDFVRGSIFKTVTPKDPNSSEKVRVLLEDPQLDPNVQEKIKIAFAEGYMAGQDVPPKVDVLPSYLFRVLKTITVVILVLLIMLITLRFIPIYFTNTRLSTMLGDVGHTVKIEEVEERFGDVRGADEVKEELKDVVEFLRNPDKFTALGAKLPKGVLLCGPPGVGKTLLARAVAGEADVPFIYASGAEFDEVYVGVGAKKIRELFNDAKSRAPCVIFLDEIDTVGAKRTNSEAHPYANQTINQLLTEMDGFKQNEGIIILGATNRRDHLDPALMRAGRFDMEIYMHPPDYNGRKEIFDLYLGKVKSGPDINLDKLARATTGFNGADIANLVNQAAIIAALQNDTCVEMSHLEYAREKITMGPVKKKRIPDEETNKVTAFHEAGHAVVAYFSKEATSPHKITIMPRGQSLGHTAFIPEKDQYNMTKTQLLAEMDVALGGRVAEEITFGSDKVTTGAGSDFEKANSIAEALVKKLGMSEKAGLRIIEDKDFMGKPHPDYSSATLEIVDNEIKRVLQDSYDRCKVLLKSHSRELQELAEALLKYETLDEDEIRMIMDGKKFVKKAPKSTDKNQAVLPKRSNKKAIKALIEGTKLSSGSSAPESSGTDS